MLRRSKNLSRFRWLNPWVCCLITSCLGVMIIVGWWWGLSLNRHDFIAAPNPETIFLIAIVPLGAIVLRRGILAGLLYLIVAIALGILIQLPFMLVFADIWRLFFGSLANAACIGGISFGILSCNPRSILLGAIWECLGLLSVFISIFFISFVFEMVLTPQIFICVLIFIPGPVLGFVVGGAAHQVTTGYWGRTVIRA